MMEELEENIYEDVPSASFKPEENIYEDVPSTGFESEEEKASEVPPTDNEETASASNARREISTIFISCSDASLQDPSDVQMDVKVEVGPSSSTSDGAGVYVEKVSEDLYSRVTGTATGKTVTILPHSDPFPEPDEDEDEDEDVDHQVERLEWDVSDRVSEKRSSYDGNSNSPPALRKEEFNAGVRDAGGIAGKRDDGGLPKRYSVEIAEKRDSGGIPKGYSVEIEERRGGEVSRRYCGEITERDAGGYPKRYPGRIADRDAGGYPEKYPGRVADRDAGGCPEKYPGRIADRDAGGYPEKYAGRIADRDAGGFKEKYAGSVADRDAGGYPEKYPAKTADRDAGGYTERYSGRSVVRRDPADIPKRYPGAADIDPIQALKRYLGKIAEDDTGGMRRRILDYLGDRDNRKNEKIYAGEVNGEMPKSQRDFGEIRKRYSTGITRTCFGVLAPPKKVSQNGKRNGSLGYQPNISPPKNKSLSSKSKTLSTVSRTADSITETFYTFDAEGGEELRVLVNGWPKLEVTKAPGSLLYEGNWADNPETGESLGDKCRTTSIIEANGCRIRMDRQCNGEEEFIALYKDDVLICKAGRRMV